MLVATRSPEPALIDANPPSATVAGVVTHDHVVNGTAGRHYWLAIFMSTLTRPKRPVH